MSNYRIIKYIIYTILITLSAGLLAVGDPSIDMGSGPLNVITGVVLDQNKMGVANANVIIPQKNISVSTSGDGTFTARFEGSGKIHIEVIKNGFMPFATKPIALKAKMSIQHQTIVLHESLLEEVVVTGTSTPKLYRETPVKTSVASKSEIEKKGAVSLADSLEIVNGVRVEDNCSNCNFTQVRINGMEGKYSQILIDGQPVVSALAGVYALEQIPANMIEKLEVVKGGGSALYGGNAVAGVVNVVTKDPANSGSRIALTQESISSKPNTSLNLNRDFVSKSQNTVLSLFTNYQKRDHADYNGDGFSDLGQLKNLSLGSNFSHYFNKINGKLRLRVNYISENRRGGNKFELPEHMADIAESVNTKRSDMGLGWEQTFSLTSILKFNASLSYTKRKSYYGAQQDPNAYGETSNPVFSGNIVYNNFSVKNHSFVGGVSYKSDSLNDKAPAYNRVIDVVYSDLGIFIQDEIDFFKGSTSLLVGVRGDKHSEISSMILSPRASLLYKGFNDLTLRATFSTGFRAPQVFDEDLHITMVGGDARLIRNRDGLKEEKSRSFTVGIDYGKQTMNRLFQVSLGGFYNQINNVFTLGKAEILSNAHIFERFNGASARVYGVEVEAGFKFAGKFEVFSGWTFQTSKLDDPDPDFGSTKLFRSPDIYGSLRLEYNVPKLATLRTELKYTGSMNVPHYRGYISEDKLETSKAFVVMDFSASKRIDFGKGGVTVVASIVNVFDRFQEDLDRGAFRDAGYIYGPRLPRTFRIGLKYDF